MGKFFERTPAKWASHSAEYRIGRLKFQAARWPWMRRTSRAILESGDVKVGDKWGWKLINKDSTLGRWGGGQQWSFGIHGGTHSITLDLLWGYVSISWHKET